MAAGATLGLLALALAIAPVDAATALKARIRNNTLTVTGSPAADVIVLRLAVNDSTTLEIDAGGDGSADLTFQRSRFDEIEVQAGGGNDTLRIDNIGGVFSDTEVTRLSGEDGQDDLIGGAGPESLSGGPGDDTLDGNLGQDTIAGDAGADVITWDPGDSSDRIDGGTGADRLAFRGANVGETIEVVPAAGRVRLTRNVGTVTLDIGSLETIGIDARGGADALGVGDLSSTELDLVAIDLAATSGGGDGAADSVVVNGSVASDTTTISGIAGGVELAVQGGGTTRVVSAEAGFDHVYVDGAGGSDIVEAAGTSGADTMHVTANGPLAAIHGDPLGSSVVETADEAVRLIGSDGADTLTATGNLAAITTLVFDGGDGADTLIGGNGADVLNGGAGKDAIDGNQGSDQVDGGADNDLLLWDPGDGSESIEGGTGADSFAFHGSGASENIDVDAVAGRARVRRDVATVTVDLGSVERVDISTRGSVDTVDVEDLSTTDLELVTVDLSATLGGGDLLADRVTVHGGPDSDTIAVSGVDGSIEATVQGGATSRISGAEAALDIVAIDGGDGGDIAEFNGTGGPDTIGVIPLADRVVVNGSPFASVILETVDETVRLNGLGDADTLSVNPALPMPGIVLDGGDGSDNLIGANGADVLFGGDGDDTIRGGQGVDQIAGDAGDDLITWSPGDSNDAVDGGTGTDRLAFRGSNIGEVIEIAAAADGRVLVTRNVALVSLNIGGVETLDVVALGGSDAVTVNDLSATEVDAVNVDLAAAVGGGDAVADTVTVTGGPASETMTVSTSGGAVVAAVSGGATTRIASPEVAFDFLVVNGQDGDDVIDVVGAVDALIQLILNP